MTGYEKSFLDSAFRQDNRFQDIGDTRRWLKALQSSPEYAVHRIRFDQLGDWYFEAGTANIRHASGRFFSIEGLDCRPQYGAPGWQQPIIHQPEIGILGLITKEFGGLRYFLMQAKMEPGNINRVQLSPTVQATYSNYTQVHKGRTPPYLEYFLGKDAAVIHDQLQSETGTRFFQKFNRNMLVDVRQPVDLLPCFRWLTLGELQTLMAEDNMVNMDARSVLSNIEYGTPETAQRQASEFLRSAQCRADALRPMGQLRDWLDAMRRKYTIATTPIALNRVSDWVMDEWSVRHKDNKFFSVEAIAVEAGEREVPRWSQPILRHEGLGLAGFLCRRILGVLHFLIQCKPEPGIAGSVELGPTVSLSDYRSRQDQVGSVPFLELFRDPGAGRVRYSAVHSEEGGRFWNLCNHFLVVEVPENQELDIPERYDWMTLAQLRDFAKGTSRVNSEARSLLACLKFDAA